MDSGSGTEFIHCYCFWWGNLVLQSVALLECFILIVVTFVSFLYFGVCIQGTPVNAAVCPQQPLAVAKNICLFVCFSRSAVSVAAYFFVQGLLLISCDMVIQKDLFCSRDRQIVQVMLSLWAIFQHLRDASQIANRVHSSVVLLLLPRGVNLSFDRE